MHVGRGTLAPADDDLLVEVFRNDQEPVDRFEVTKSSIVAVPTGDGNTTNLAFVPLPALAIHMRYSPGDWLLWFALGFAFLGALGYLGRAGFLLGRVGALAGASVRDGRSEHSAQRVRHTAALAWGVDCGRRETERPQ